MTEFVSNIQAIPYPQENVYRVLSDLSNLEQLKDRIPQDKIEDFSFDTDSCSFSINPVGKITFSIVEREPVKTIKFAADQSPVAVFLWIQLKETSASETKMKLTVKAELNPFIKPMVSKPLQEGINKIADMLANIPY
ncbi:MAG: SRPBCC family protein [Dysgonamonadaceae bacterium]|jgi:carbon monoxide dehydrogenase subunit G|nr:SRPBCC family protein [Dysgonamonadaceae bacterium]